MTYRGTYGEDEDRRYGDRYGGWNRRYVDDYPADPLQGGRRYGEDYGIGPAWRWRGHNQWEGPGRRGDWESAFNDDERSWYDAAGETVPRWRGPRANRWDQPGYPVYGAYGGYRGSNEPYWQSNGPHVGKGPKGYRRSDERIREDVSDRLTENGYLDASGVAISVDAGVVVLSGEVEDRNEKRLVEDIADSVSGVHDVRNELRIRNRAVGHAATATH